MSAATSLSRLTGYLRTMTQAATLGTGAVAGAYTLSNALPTQIYELFMGGLLSSVLVPILVERLTRHGEEDARAFTNALLTLMLPFLAALAVLGIVFAEPLILLTTDWSGSGNLSPEESGLRVSLAVLLFRVFALQILFYGIGALATGILNTHRRFFLPTFAPVLNNLVVILSFIGYALLVGSRPEVAVYTLAAGTTLGVAVMSLILVPSALRLGYRPRFQLDHPALGRAARLAAPVFILVAATVGVQLVANLFASRFDGVDELYYAYIVFLLPYGVFVVSIATALAPELSEKFTYRDAEGYRDVLSSGLRSSAFVTVPALAGLAAFAVPIVGLLYQRGEFGPDDTRLVASVLTAFAIGLPGYAVQFVLVRAFYARQNSATPAALNVGLFVAFVGSAYLLSNVFGLVGVALGFSFSYTLLALALLFAMRRAAGGIGGRRLVESVVKILIAGAAMYAVARLGVYLTGTGSSLPGRLLILTLTGSISLAIYLALAYLLRVEEFQYVISLMQNRRRS
ncbi:N/A [soil metagenome]